MSNTAPSDKISELTYMNSKRIQERFLNREKEINFVRKFENYSNIINIKIKHGFGFHIFE